MIENTNIKIEHNNVTFQERVKYYLLIFLGVVSTFGLFQVFSKKAENFLAYITAISVSFGLLLGYKIYKTKRYVRDFYSDSKKIEICYLNYSDEKTLISSIEEIEVFIKNTSARSSFNFEIQIIINDLKFSINKDFEWSFSEMKYLFEYIKFYKNEKLTENEKILISRIK